MRVATAKVSVSADANRRRTIRREQHTSHALEAIEREPNVHARQHRSWGVGDGRCSEFLTPVNSGMELWLGCGSETGGKACVRVCVCAEAELRDCVRCLCEIELHVHYPVRRVVSGSSWRDGAAGARACV
ncbi:hypothetical protein ERJ75_001174700 [Trypanosoma vivax]|nr:hypothetical protein ERJ75_001174700 [Trypanosoma vivax]